uniref:Uncharacterized protein n=1 Tax=Anguilla anguilla TaxID=7936 RepID=A0A0E9P946_ANGAN
MYLYFLSRQLVINECFYGLIMLPNEQPSVH